MEAATQVAVRRVNGTRWASITLYQGTVVTTAAASDERARRADQIQHELGYRPSVDAVVEDTVYACGDSAAEPRWPEFGRRVSVELGIHSMLAYRLALDTDQVIASLNLHSDRRHAFDDEALAVRMLLATHGALAVSVASIGNAHTSCSGRWRPPGHRRDHRDPHAPAQAHPLTGVRPAAHR